MKVQINAKYLKELGALALRNGTIPAWMDLVFEWAEMAEEEIQRLQKLVEDKNDTP